MKLKLIREHSNAYGTQGILLVDGKLECYTQEDVIRTGLKVPGETAIPAGTYEVRITYSPRFKRMLPLLWDVPGFEGIRIHPGNTAKDTEGCILPGLARNPVQVFDSKVAFDKLFAKLSAAPPRSIFIEITNP